MNRKESIFYVFFNFTISAEIACTYNDKPPCLQALNAVNPQLFTIATLTGHAIKAYGPEYSVSELKLQLLCRLYTNTLNNGPCHTLLVDSLNYNLTSK